MVAGVVRDLERCAAVGHIGRVGAENDRVLIAEVEVARIVTGVGRTIAGHLLIGAIRQRFAVHEDGHAIRSKRHGDVGPLAFIEHTTGHIGHVLDIGVTISWGDPQEQLVTLRADAEVAAIIGVAVVLGDEDLFAAEVGRLHPQGYRAFAEFVRLVVLDYGEGVRVLVEQQARRGAQRAGDRGDDLGHDRIVVAFGLVVERARAPAVGFGEHVADAVAAAERPVVDRDDAVLQGHLVLDDDRLGRTRPVDRLVALQHRPILGLVGVLEVGTLRRHEILQRRRVG